MLSDADYQELKAQQHNLNNEGRAALREYELSNPQHVATGALGASGQQKLQELPPKPAADVNVPELPAESPVEGGSPELQSTATQHLDTTRDGNLPTASKLKILNTPPEYVPKDPLASLKQVAVATLKDPLDGPSVGVYHEPSEKQFQADMGPVLEARKLVPGSPAYKDAFDEYKDRKWAQAYQQAQATDTPLTRAEYVPRSSAWEQLKGMLEQAPDLASTFAKGFASGRTLHATDTLATDADLEQAQRNPIAHAAGELVGSAGATAPLAKITKGASNLAARVLPGNLFGRLAGGAVAGAASGASDLAGASAAEGIRDEAHGGTLDNASRTCSPAAF